MGTWEALHVKFEAKLNLTTYGTLTMVMIKVLAWALVTREVAIQGSRNTYISPTANIMATGHFFCHGNCRRATNGNGRTRMNKSWIGSMMVNTSV